MAVVVDTSVLVAAEREWMGSGQAVLPSLPGTALSAVSVMELRVGALLATSETRREARTYFIDYLVEQLSVLPFSALEATVAADLLVRLRRAGQPIGERDLMIAATAIALDHRLATLNVSEFVRVPGLVLWEPLAP